jgi:hypothetical protein
MHTDAVTYRTGANVTRYSSNILKYNKFIEIINIYYGVASS